LNTNKRRSSFGPASADHSSSAPDHRHRRTRHRTITHGGRGGFPLVFFGLILVSVCLGFWVVVSGVGRRGAPPPLCLHLLMPRSQTSPSVVFLLGHAGMHPGAAVLRTQELQRLPQHGWVCTPRPMPTPAKPPCKGPAASWPTTADLMPPSASLVAVSGICTPWPASSSTCQRTRPASSAAACWAGFINGEVTPENP